MKQHFFWFFAACSCATGLARATTFEVSPTGSDAAAGSAAAPWLTLQKAADTAGAGDIVLVNDGTYAGFLQRKNGTAALRITFKSKNKWGAKVTSVGVKGGVDNITLLSASYVTIDGFEVSTAPRAGVCARSLGDDTGADTRDDIIQNCYCHHNGLPSGGAHDGIFTGFALNVTAQFNVCDSNGEHGIYFSNSADNPIARGNRCSNNRNCGIQLNADLETGNGGQDGLISNWLVEENVIYGNGTGGGSAVNLDGDQSGICRNNLIYDNLATGIALYAIDGAIASSNNLVVNNTIVNPASNRAALLVMDGANNNVAFNNILYSKNGIEAGTVTGFNHDYNLVSSYDGATKSAHESAPASGALFVASGDFHLKAGSAALDAGIASFGGKTAPGKDIEAVTRPQGPAFDIGCYEKSAPQAYNLRGRVVRWETGNNGTAAFGVKGAQILKGAQVLATTGDDGRFTIANLTAGSLTVSAQKTGVVFDPPTRTVVLPTTGETSSPDGKAKFSTYAIVGVVRNAGGQPLAGIAVQLSGAAVQQTVSGADGHYSFIRLGTGNYQVTPQGISGFVFTPLNKALSLPTANINGLSPNGRAGFVRSKTGG